MIMVKRRIRIRKWNQIDPLGTIQTMKRRVDEIEISNLFHIDLVEA